MSLPTATPKLRLLHYLFTHKPDGRVVGHCLDFDLVVGAPNEEEGVQRLDTVVKSYVERALQCGNYAALSTTSAPERFWQQFTEAFQAGRRLEKQLEPLSIRMPDVLPMDQINSNIAILAAAA